MHGALAIEFERDHDDSRLARLLDHAIDGGFGSGVDEQHVDLLEDQFADLAVLLRNRAVAVHHDVIRDLPLALGLLGRRLERLDHLVAPGVSVIGVR